MAMMTAVRPISIFQIVAHEAKALELRGTERDHKPVNLRDNGGFIAAIAHFHIRVTIIVIVTETYFEHL